MQLERVGKRYGMRQPWVVRAVTASVSGGQLIRLEGRNGSGKSTLLRMAAGITLPSSGRVTGRPVRTGYVPERFPGGLAFSARDYMIHMGRIHGLRGQSAVAATEEWLDRLGAAEYAGASLRTLSKGMCQKVAIGQALMARPGLLILDEAWTGLDQAARGTLDAAVGERLAEGGTVMFVDHHQARLAGKISQRWILRGGQVQVLDGPGAAAAAAAPGVSSDEPELIVLIELSGLDAESVPQLAGLAGVRSLQRVPPIGGSGSTTVHATVEASASDALLRHVMTWDDVHVIAVSPGPGAGS